MANTRVPNVLLLVADQLRYDCLGRAGRFPVQTPNIDRLAGEGAFLPVLSLRRQSVPLQGRRC